MSRKTHRAAAFAVAATLAFTIFGADGSGAHAQASETAAIAAPAGVAAAEPGQPQFVAEPVVQPVPGDAASSDDSDPPASLGELVSDMPVDGSLSEDMRCLAEAIYFEARGEPLAGQLAVGEVIINRAESDAFPDDYCGVVTQPSQFSFVRGGHIPQINQRSPAWKRAVAIARIAHRDLWDSPAKDALYFHATRVHPKWAYRKLASATIDRHIFYR